MSRHAHIKSLAIPRLPNISCIFLPFVLLIGCGFKASLPDAPLPVGNQEKPHILLISIDSLRPDHLGAYGYSEETSPSIDDLASDGVVFEAAASSSSWTLPGHAALFTALPDYIHGTVLGSRTLSPKNRTLAETLSDSGYHTAGFWSGPLLDPDFGLAQGFDDYISCAGYAVSRKDGGWQKADALSHVDITSVRLVEAVQDWLAQRPPGPFFLFLHMWDVHYDYIPPAPYDTLFDPGYEGSVDGGGLGNKEELQRNGLPTRDLEHLIALYDGEIAWTDAHVGKILREFDRIGIANDTIVVLTADHGEEFFEHGRFGHRRQLYEESIRIPLVIRYPGHLPRGHRVLEPVRIVDIAPTILDLAGVSPLPNVLGESLVPLMLGKREPEGRLIVSELTFRNQPSLLAVRRDSMKVLHRSGQDQPVGVWNLEKDPGEQHNLVENEATALRGRILLAETQRRFRELEEAHSASTAKEQVLTPELESELRSLGYLD